MDDVCDFSFSPDSQCSCNATEIVVSLSFPVAHISRLFLYSITSTIYFEYHSYLNPHSVL